MQRGSLLWHGCLLFAMMASCATSPPPEESLPSTESPPRAEESSDAQPVDGGGQDGAAAPSASEEDASRDRPAAARDASSQTENASWPASDAGAAATQEAGSSLLYPPTNVSAQDFCSKYQQYCGFGGSMRYASMSACISNYNANPQQQGCYNYHLNAAISGTATLCTSPPTAQCFAIHCPHATGMGGYCM